MYRVQSTDVQSTLLQSRVYRVQSTEYRVEYSVQNSVQGTVHRVQRGYRDRVQSTVQSTEWYRVQKRVQLGKATWKG